MVRNLRRRIPILGLASVWVFSILTHAQEEETPPPQDPPLSETQSSPAPPPEVSTLPPHPPDLTEQFQALEEKIDQKTSESGEEIRGEFTRLRQAVESIEGPQSLLKKPAIWLVLGFFMLLPVAILLLGYGLLQRLARQHDELRRQRLRLEGVEESLRELPGNLPRPTLDVPRLAERLRTDLGTMPPAPPEPATPVPAPVATPFYHNEHWLHRAVEGPRRYLEHLREVREAVAEVYEDLTQSDDPGESLALTSWMLSRFYHRQREGAEDRWHQLLRTAEETGYLCDLALSERLEQAQSDEEAARTLHRALYRELLEHSISDHLILLEEMRHLPNFCGSEPSYAACQAIAQKIDPLVEAFLSATRRLAGYTPNHVPLFSEFTDEAAHFLRNNPSERLPGVYQHLDLPRRQVLCVLAYGLRRERGWENEETQVILS